MVLVAIFFVSGADAASIVMGTLSEQRRPEPSRCTVIFWGVATGAVAAVMLLAGGDATRSTGLQNDHHRRGAAVRRGDGRAAVALVKDLRRDPLMVRRTYGAEAVDAGRRSPASPSTATTSR